MSKAELTNVLLVDADVVYRAGLMAIFKDCRPHDRCEEAPDAVGALTLIRQRSPHLVVLDIDLPETDGLMLIRELLSAGKSIAIMVLSRYEEAEMVRRTFQAGALAYIVKGEPLEEFLRGVDAALASRRYVSSRLSSHVFEMLSSRRSSTGTEMLSNRELAVFQLIGTGEHRATIARSLGISVKTVESHVERIKNKMKIKSADELRVNAIRWNRERHMV